MQTASDADYGYLRQLVFGLSQNVLDPSRDYLFETRLSKLLRNQGMTHLEELVQHLRIRKNPPLERAIAEAMTINETSFFRDSRPFELLRTELLPKLIEARRSTRSLRFWSAACSTGQEAYSLGMLMREHFHLIADWNIRIEGTDICAEVVEQAQLPPGQPVRAVPAIQSFHRSLRRHLPAQRDALFLAGDSAHAAEQHSPDAGARRHPLSGIERATGGSVSVDLEACGRYVLPQAEAAELVGK